MRESRRPCISLSDQETLAVQGLMLVSGRKDFTSEVDQMERELDRLFEANPLIRRRIIETQRRGRVPRPPQRWVELQWKIICLQGVMGKAVRC